MGLTPSPLVTRMTRLGATAEAIVSSFVDRGAAVPGLGHPVHKPVDPRAEKLFAIASEHVQRGEPSRPSSDGSSRPRAARVRTPLGRVLAGWRR